MNRPQRPLTPEQQEAQRLDEIRETNLGIAYERLMNSEDFRLAMTDYLRNGGVLQAPMTGNSHTFFEIGKMAQALDMLKLMKKGNPSQTAKILLDLLGE